MFFAMIFRAAGREMPCTCLLLHIQSLITT